MKTKGEDGTLSNFDKQNQLEEFTFKSDGTTSEDQIAPQTRLATSKNSITPGTAPINYWDDAMALTPSQVTAYNNQIGFYAYNGRTYSPVPEARTVTTVMARTGVPMASDPNTTIWRSAGLGRTFTMANFGNSNLGTTGVTSAGISLTGTTQEVLHPTNKVAVIFTSIASQNNYTGGGGIIYKLNTETGMLIPLRSMTINDPFDPITPNRTFVVHYGDLKENEVLFFSNPTRPITLGASGDNNPLVHKNPERGSLAPSGVGLGLSIYNYK